VDHDALEHLLLLQVGVIARRQLVECGCRPHDIERLLRRGELVRVHPGVYVNHTGPPSWPQRAWAAVLALWPAALCDRSALLDDAGEELIHVAVDRGRHVATPTGVRVHRMDRLDERVLWSCGPPRQRYEHAALDVAAAAPSEFAAFGVLAEACRTRRTTPQRLADTLANRPRLHRRAWLADVLADLAAGTASVLERQYLRTVERAHRLPRAQRQVRAVARTGVVYRDAEYAGGLIVELDGRIVHNTIAQRDADLDRDLDAAVDGRTTVRLSWGQVVGRPCATAARLAVLLQRRGRTGQPTHRTTASDGLRGRPVLDGHVVRHVVHPALDR
jgi:hypothetical protein